MTKDEAFEKWFQNEMRKCQTEALDIRNTAVMAFYSGWDAHELEHAKEIEDLRLDMKETLTYYEQS